MSDSAGSVSLLIERLKQGEGEAATHLWDLYFRRLLGLARARLAPLRRRGVADEEDVALSAFHDFCHAARADRYEQLHGRGDLWRVLAAFVANKAKTLVDYEMAARRDVRRTQGQSALAPPDGGSSAPQEFAGKPSKKPDPALAAEMEERFQRLLARLSDQEAAIASLRMEGHSTPEIAGQLAVSPPTVRRRLAYIREVMEDEFGV